MNLKLEACDVKSPNYDFSDESPEGEFVETIFAAQGQLEQKQNARQVKQKMKARLERGLWSFPHCLTGYSYEKTVEYGKLATPNWKAKYIIKEGLEGFAYKKYITIVSLAKF